MIYILRFILGLTNWYESWEITSQAAIEADELGFWGLSMRAMEEDLVGLGWINP
jgi:hypothetical protein